MKIRTTVALALTSAVAAQTPPCLSDNDLTTNVSNAIYAFSTVEPGYWAWQITPSQAQVVLGARVYTGNTFTSSVGEYMTIEIWDEDPSAPGAPANRLGGGTWSIRSALSWQGADLDAPVVLQQGQPYWIAFVEPGWSTPPIEPGGNSLPGARRQNGAWTSIGSSALKYRLYCGYLDGQGIVSQGAACASSTGVQATSFTNEAPSLGNADFQIEGTGFEPGLPVLQALGTIPGFPSVAIPGTNGCFQSTNLEVALSGTAGTGDVRAATASGHVVFPTPIPNSANLAGFYFASQLVGLDPTSTQPLPFVTSNAVQVTLF